MLGFFALQARKHRLYSVDEYGVREYHLWLVAGVVMALLAILALILGYVAYWAEAAAGADTIPTYWDGVWMMFMSASTIGFGGILAASLIGRLCVIVMFMTGLSLLSGVGVLLGGKVFGLFDNSVKNRELRLQNAEILSHVKQLSNTVAELRAELAEKGETDA